MGICTSKPKEDPNVPKPDPYPKAAYPVNAVVNNPDSTQVAASGIPQSNPHSYPHNPAYGTQMTQYPGPPPLGTPYLPGAPYAGPVNPGGGDDRLMQGVMIGAMVGHHNPAIAYLALSGELR